MQTLIQTFKRFADFQRWRQWAIVLLAGLLMVVTTACGTAKATAPELSNSDAANVAPSESMYPYRDTDRDTTAADAKTERAMREAHQRIQRDLDESLGDQAEEVGEAAQKAAENIGKSTQRAAEDVGRSTQRTAEDISKSTQRTVEDLGKSTQQAAENTADKARGLVNGAAKAID